MREIFLFAFIACCLCSRGQDFDVLHYRFALSLHDVNDSINGTTSITFVAQKSNRVFEVDLVKLRKDGKGMRVNRVFQQIDGPNLSFTHENDKVLISLPASLPTDTITLRIDYHGIPADGLIISKNKYGDRTFFADNWPNRARHWLPCIDRPDDKASFDFSVTAPRHYNVISNGVRKREHSTPGNRKLTIWSEATPLPTKVMVIGAAKFATKTYDNSPEGIPVSAWVYPQDSTKGFYDYALAPDILKFFSDYIAPFPYKKLANVQSKTIFGGMENASAIFYAENSVTGDRSSEDLLAHEIAHQWFGDMASEKSFAHLWLSEGFATFLTNYYWEKKYGKEAAAKRWQENRDEVIAFAKQNPRPVVDSTKNLMSLLNANSYQKGAWVLHMLRNEVGDSSFQKIIQTYYNQYKGGNAETRDFEAVAEKVSGKELTWFFNQWLYQPFIPKISVQYRKEQKGISITITQLQLTPFRFALPYTVGKQKMGELVVSKQKETFFIANDGGELIIDPNTTLLFEKSK